MKLLTILGIIILFFNSSLLADDLECVFSTSSSNYTCTMETDFKTKVDVTNITGTPLTGKNNSDVTVFHQKTDNPSKYLPNQICSQLNNIKQFDIDGKELVEIEKELFDGCTKLTHVSLKNIALTTLDEDLLVNIPKLEFFSLENSLVETLPAKLFQNNMNTLKVVEIANNNQLTVMDTKFPPFLTTLLFAQEMCTDQNYTRTAEDEQTETNNFDAVIQEIKKCIKSTTNGASQGTIITVTSLHNDTQTKANEELKKEMNGTIENLNITLTQENVEKIVKKTADLRKDLNKIKAELKSKGTYIIIITTVLVLMILSVVGAFVYYKFYNKSDSQQTGVTLNNL